MILHTSSALYIHKKDIKNIRELGAKERLSITAVSVLHCDHLWVCDEHGLRSRTGRGFPVQVLQWLGHLKKVTFLGEKVTPYIKHIYFLIDLKGIHFVIK